MNNFLLISALINNKKSRIESTVRESAGWQLQKKVYYICYIKIM